jgi:hypothetical protein
MMINRYRADYVGDKVVVRDGVAWKKLVLSRDPVVKTLHGYKIRKGPQPHQNVTVWKGKSTVRGPKGDFDTLAEAEAFIKLRARNTHHARTR